jgi:hypothetical protein
MLNNANATFQLSPLPSRDGTLLALGVEKVRPDSVRDGQTN